MSTLHDVETEKDKNNPPAGCCSSHGIIRLRRSLSFSVLSAVVAVLVVVVVDIVGTIVVVVVVDIVGTIVVVVAIYCCCRGCY